MITTSISGDKIIRIRSISGSSRKSGSQQRGLVFSP
jgi:hypothetical protein